MSIINRHFRQIVRVDISTAQGVEIEKSMSYYHDTFKRIAKKADECAHGLRTAREQYEAAGVYNMPFAELEAEYEKVADFFEKLFNAAAQGDAAEYVATMAEIGQPMSFPTRVEARIRESLSTVGNMAATGQSPEEQQNAAIQEGLRNVREALRDARQDTKNMRNKI